MTESIGFINYSEFFDSTLRILDFNRIFINRKPSKRILRKQIERLCISRNVHFVQLLLTIDFGNSIAV